MPEVFSKETRSRIMSQIRSKDTKCELALRRALRSLGLRGYRLHFPELIGTPDIVFLRQKVVVFCDSDFWHGRKTIPKSNREYWEKKLRKNAERDLKVNEALQGKGWKVIRLSESEILKNPQECARRVQVLVSDVG